MPNDIYEVKEPHSLAKLGIIFFPKVRPSQKINSAKTRFEAQSQHNPKSFMPLGAYSYTHSVFSALKIGRYCSISENVRVMGAKHPVSWVTTSPITYSKRKRRLLGIDGDNAGHSFNNSSNAVVIGHDVWIGQDVILRDGITIGDGAVVAAGSVVTKNVASYTVVGGNPAREIKRRFEKEIVNEVLYLNWWNFRYDCLQHLDFSDPRAFIKGFASTKNLTELPELRLDIHAHLKRKK